MTDKRIGAESNGERAKELALKVVEKFEQVEVTPEVKELASDTISQIMMTLKPDDFIEMGFRMRPKETSPLCDETVLGEVVGGFPIYEGTAMADPHDYKFMREVVKEVRKILN